MASSKALVSMAAASVRRQASVSTIRQLSPPVGGSSSRAGVMLRPSCGRGLSTSGKPKAQQPPPPSESSSKPSSTSTYETVEIPSSSNKGSADSDPTMKNVIMATGLFTFVAGVFTYSLNAVGRGEESTSSDMSELGGDPLAQLKAEAQEARQMEKYQTQGKVMSKEEINALETGRSNVSDDAQSMADALEEEASRNVFQDGTTTTTDGSSKKKKPWWRFGF